MRCKATFNVNKPPHFHRPVKCDLPLGHNGWHEYGTIMWAQDEKQVDYAESHRVIGARARKLVTRREP